MVWRGTIKMMWILRIFSSNCIEKLSSIWMTSSYVWSIARGYELHVNEFSIRPEQRTLDNHDPTGRVGRCK